MSGFDPVTGSNDRQSPGAGSPHIPATADAHALLARLTRLVIVGAYDVRARLHEVLRHGLHMVNAERVMIWRLSEEREELRVHVTASSSSGAARSLPIALRCADNARYFHALENGEVMVACSGRIDPPLTDLWSKYADANDIGAKLDVPLLAGGQTFGLLSFERLGVCGGWSTDEVTLALSIANLVQLGGWDGGESRTASALLDAFGERFEHALPVLRNYRRL